MRDLRLKLMVTAFVGLMAFASFARPMSSVINPRPQPYDGSGRVLSFQALPDMANVPKMNARYAGGYEITATGTSLFEGLSDLLVTPTPEGVGFAAVSDFGYALRFGFDDDASSQPVQIETLKGPDRKAFGNKALADAEGLARDDATGDYYVSYEGEHRVMRYPAATGLFGPGERLPLKGLPSFPDNEGMEALTFHRGSDGASLIIGAESGGIFRCGLENNQCAALKADTGPGFGYAIVSLRGFDTARPDEFLALYRFYAPMVGVRTKLRRVQLNGDRLERIEDILIIAPPMPNDNYESIGAVKTPNGYRLFLISDPLEFDQKTRLLMFDWTPGQ